MTRTLKFFAILSILTLFSCEYDSGLDLTHAEWKASLGNHIKSILEKSNVSSSFSQNKKKNSENWKSISSFPVDFNLFLKYRNNPDFTK